ncbi:MAG: hypothetical protein WCI79_02580 [Candidatus Saccharibacteria bacterium]
MVNKKQQITKTQWGEMSEDEKKKVKKKFIIIAIIVFVIICIGGSGSKTVNTAQTSTPTEPKQQVVAPVEPVTPKYSFDVPSLLGKDIDEVRLILGAPEDKTLSEPTAEQISLGADEWDNTFKKDGKELLVTFSANTRKVVDFFISADDPSGVTTDVQHLLDIGNLKEGASNYTIKQVKALKNPSAITGIIVSE